MSHRNLHTVSERFGWKCFYCGAALRCKQCQPHGRGAVATRDHFVPKSKGGGRGANLVAACWGCNKRKGDGEYAYGTKLPKARSLGGCQYGRTGRASRTRRPHKAFVSLALANAMIEAVGVEDLVPWLCPGCGQYHIASVNAAMKAQHFGWSA